MLGHKILAAGLQADLKACVATCSVVVQPNPHRLHKQRLPVSGLCTKYWPQYMMGGVHDMQAYAELKAYAGTNACRNASGGERELVSRLLKFMQEDAEGQPAAAVLTVASSLQETRPVVNNDKPIPLTW